MSDLRRKAGRLAVAAIVAAMASTSGTSRGDEPIRAGDEEYLRSRKLFTSAFRMFAEGRTRGDDEEAKRVVLPARALEPMARFMDSHEALGGDPEAAEALSWISKMSVNDGQLVADRARRALLRDHMESGAIGVAVSGANLSGASGSAVAEAFLRRVAEGERPGEVEERARYWLARFLIERAEFAAYLEANRADPAVVDRALDVARRYWGPGAPARLLGADAEADRREAERLLRLLVDSGSTASTYGHGTSGPSLAESAAEDLDALISPAIAVGSAAPEIVGEQADGTPLRLSDYRGDVVALVFWGTWCGPCMEQVPHHRELVARLRGEPFALLGVNSDRDPETLADRMAAEGITWPSWWDHRDDTFAGPIAEAWGVQGWPSTFVLDHRGVVRFIDVRGKALDQAVDALLKERSDDVGL